MDRARLAEAAGEDSYVVGGAVRDALLGRPVLDLDLACAEPRRAAEAYAGAAGGAVFPLSERHGAWRVASRDGRTVDFTPLRGTLEEDLESRDFTVNAIAEPVLGGDLVDPFDGVGDLEARTLRAVSESAFRDDPLRLLRAARLEDELGFRLDPRTDELVRAHAELVDRPAGERILGELLRLSADGLRRLGELGLLGPLGGDASRLDEREQLDDVRYRLVVVFGEALLRLPISNELRRFAQSLLRASPPDDRSPRAIHRFRRRTEPWALEALAYVGAGEQAGAVRAARAGDPAYPLLRGDELGLPPGPEVGRLLELVEEERAAGTISTREEALELVRREVGASPSG
jgi:Poly A polymerase head domain